jgi:hypothetical protein
MSNYQASGGVWAPVKAKITTTDVATIVAAGRAVALVSLTVVNITANTPALTVAIYNGTSRYYLRYAQAMTAKERVEFTLGYPLDRVSTVEVSIGSDAVDVYGTIITNSQQ